MTNSDISEERGSAGLVSAVSHEFAQPLASVTSLADLLATDWADLPDATKRDLAMRIDAGTRELAARYRRVVVEMDMLSGRAYLLATATSQPKLLGREPSKSRVLGLVVAARLLANAGGPLSHRSMRRRRGERVVIRLSLAL